VAVMPVPIEEAHRFGIMKVDENSRIVEFHEKPKDPDKGNLASLGIYVFDAEALDEQLRAGVKEHPDLDFGKHVIPGMLASDARVFAYRYEGYWVDVGTIDSYWATNLELVRSDPALDLFTTAWPVLTRSEERPAVKIGPQAKVTGSMISNGCVIGGLVENSVLSPGVHVSPGAVVQNSIVMNNTWIGPGARLDKAVVDKQCVIGAGAIIGVGDESVPNQEMPDKLTHGITVIGKGAYIPVGAQLGRNVLVNSNRDESDFPENGIVPDGGTI